MIFPKQTINASYSCQANWSPRPPRQSCPRRPDPAVLFGWPASRIHAANQNTNNATSLGTDDQLVAIIGTWRPGLPPALQRRRDQVLRRIIAHGPYAAWPVWTGYADLGRQRWEAVWGITAYEQTYLAPGLQRQLARLAAHWSQHAWLARHRDNGWQAWLRHDCCWRRLPAQAPSCCPMLPWRCPSAALALPWRLLP